MLECLKEAALFLIELRMDGKDEGLGRMELQIRKRCNIAVLGGRLQIDQQNEGISASLSTAEGRNGTGISLYDCLGYGWMMEA